MLNDLNFTEAKGEIRIEIVTGAKVSFPVPEKLALKLLRQLGEIIALRAEKDRNEHLGHTVETPATEVEPLSGGS